MKAAWQSMLEASRQEALQAADHYNKPKHDRSLEGFFIHMHIAWLYLLHARFKRDGVDYRYWTGRRLDRVDGEPKTWDLKRCVDGLSSTRCAKTLSSPSRYVTRSSIATRKRSQQPRAATLRPSCSTTRTNSPLHSGRCTVCPMSYVSRLRRNLHARGGRKNSSGAAASPIEDQNVPCRVRRFA